MATLIYLILFVPVLFYREKFARGAFPLSGIVVFATAIIFPNFSNAPLELFIGVAIVSTILVLFDLKFPDQSSKRIGKLFMIPVWLGVFGLILMMVNFYQLIGFHGGLSNLFFRDRLSSYLGAGILSKTFLETMISAILPFVYLAIGVAFERKRTVRGVVFLGVYTLWLAITANTRIALIIPIVALGLYAYSNLPCRKRRTWLVLGFTALPIGIPFINLANYVRLGRIEDIHWMGVFNIEKVAVQLQYATWFKDLVEYLRLTGDYAYGYYWSLSQVINFVPRFLWPEKPITSVSNALSAKVYGSEIGYGEAVTTFTIYGEAYWQFGYAGFVILPIITFLAFYYFRKYLQNIVGGNYVYAIFLVKFFAVVRAESLFFHMIWAILIYSLAICLEKTLRSPRREKPFTQ